MNLAMTMPHSPTHAPTARPGRTATALVVDGDATSRRFVELALERSGAFVVESAYDVAGALEVLKAQHVEVIVSDTDLADANGLAFFRRLAQETRLRSIPFVFLSADRTRDTKLAALRAGVDDYLVKPCDVDELVARAESLVLRQRRMRDALRTRSYALAGEFSAMAFPEIVGIVEMGRRSGVLSVVTESAVGRVHFDGGAVVHAVYGNVSGEAAFQRIFVENEGHFEFTPGPCAVADEARTIGSSVTHLVMEAARLFDESVSERNSIPDVERIVVTRRPTTCPPSAPAVELVPPLEVDPLIAAQYELALRDPFALGELRAWTHGDLAKWTAREVGRDRLHVLLLADMAAGVSATLGLAGSPTERWILDSLSAEKKAFGLTFFLRHERMIDLVLLDAKEPGALLPSLARVPAAIIVCPPDGDLLSLGTAARASLEEVLDVLEPPAVVGVGNASLERGLGRLRAFQRGPSLLRCIHGSIGEEGADLRSLLVAGVRLWASSQPVTLRERQL
jgi:CheY-like chemotaxis protein